MTAIAVGLNENLLTVNIPFDDAIIVHSTTKCQVKSSLDNENVTTRPIICKNCTKCKKAFLQIQMFITALLKAAKLIYKTL